MKTNVLSEQVNEIMSQAFWGKSGVRLSENTEAQAATPVTAEVDTPVADEVVNEETHSCPLCESTLEQPISDEKLTEHIEMMLGIINEMNDITDEELEAIEEEMDSEDETEQDDLDERSCTTGTKMGSAKGQAAKMKGLMSGAKKK